MSVLTKKSSAIVVEIYYMYSVFPMHNTHLIKLYAVYSWLFIINRQRICYSMLTLLHFTLLINISYLNQLSKERAHFFLVIIFSCFNKICCWQSCKRFFSHTCTHQDLYSHKKQTPCFNSVLISNVSIKWIKKENISDIFTYMQFCIGSV